MASITLAKPIMVSFGTKQGPIVPSTPISTTVNPLAPRNAAPVYETVDDVPDTNRYRPLTPHQYRSEILAHKPNPNLILGTPIDIKYTPSLNKYELYEKKARLAQSEGLSYKGPQEFGVQAYEIERAQRKLAERRYDAQQISYPAVPNQQNENKAYQSTDQRPVYQVREPQNYQSSYQYHNQNTKYVPQIGIIYSSGLRYYVPQIVYYNPESENSVYEKNEQKYVYPKTN